MNSEFGTNGPKAISPRRGLPLGVQNFREIREEDWYYVDKTGFIGRMIREGKHYFLSRPRRFGKSLLLDTIKCLFEAEEHLFKGLDIHGSWDWTARHPVIRLDFGRSDFEEDSKSLHVSVMAQLDSLGRRTGLTSDYATGPERLADFIEQLREAWNRRVVVLVDEYDKPILDALHLPELARKNRRYLRGLYGAIKSMEGDVRFTLLAGVSKFSKVNLFSGLNNLTDVTLDPAYSSICGYTENDLDSVFAPELQGLNRENIRDWYNGYNWLGSENVYNPYGVLQLFRRKQFRPHWFETGSPKFLIESLSRRPLAPLQLERLIASEELLSRFDVEDMSVEALLFQTGYLTIKSARERGSGMLYELGYPNREVRQSLNLHLIPLMGADNAWSHKQEERLFDLMDANNFEGLEAFFRSFLQAIPYEWHMNNTIARYEGYYASLFYCLYAAAGFNPAGEVSSSGGRADMVIAHNDQYYIFEFKMVDRVATGTAMAQMLERDYAAPYRRFGRPIHQIAVEFSRETRGIADYEAVTT